jgi:KipI family sensor histidine kinase inhibitor
MGADAVLQTLPGVLETVPALRSVLVVYDPLRVRFSALAGLAESCARDAPPTALDTGRLVEVPVAYGGALGPDLEAVAVACGLPAAEVIRLHCQPTYLVLMLGFAPGYPYLGMLPEPIRLPRRSSPRPRVPAGSVAIADAFTGIYPQDTPGGWHLLGRTSLRPFDTNRDPVVLLRPGDRVRFTPTPEAGAPIADAPCDGPARSRRPVLEVLQPGLLTTIQDAGRPGWRRYGVPASGAVDRAACAAANALIGNAPAAAALEFTFPGPHLRVMDAVEIALAGADLGARLNGAPVRTGEPLRARQDDEIAFHEPVRGQWAYLAVAGGLDVPQVFASRSTYARGGLPGLAGRPLRAGDVLGRGEGPTGLRRIQPRETSQGSGRIRVVLGPQLDAFTVEAIAALVGQPFEVTARRDRSGMRLRGPSLRHSGSPEILSDGMLPGAIQVPADGQPIVILADGPTTGGYPKIAHVVTADLDRLAQAAPGASVRFEAVTADEGGLPCS